ncbi:MAG: dephospho-CoA kinase [Verrucomicrobiales bacterium]|nr:dephospho-CoA kinase [Verrucomicrobiales bacterium]
MMTEGKGSAKMFVLAITGGVASGKSLFTRLFAQITGDATKCFDCDQVVHALLDDETILEGVKNIFGQAVISHEGKLDRKALRERVFNSEADRIALQDLLHPRVLRQVEAFIASSASQDESLDYVMIEVPLLYEVDFSLQRDTDVVVATSAEVQLKRLREDRGLSDEVIEQILKAQLPIEDKISRAHQVIWNDGSEAELIEQAHLLKAWIDKKVGE